MIIYFPQITRYRRSKNNNFRVGKINGRPLVNYGLTVGGGRWGNRPNTTKCNFSFNIYFTSFKLIIIS